MTETVYLVTITEIITQAFIELLLKEHLKRARGVMSPERSPQSSNRDHFDSGDAVLCGGDQLVKNRH